MKRLKSEEALEILDDMKVKIEIPKAAVMQYKRNAALDMAIEALKCSEIPNCSDCISRQAAIDLAHELIIPMDKYRQYNQGINNYCAEIIKLPSAQPEIICSEIPNSSDTISRQVAIDALDKIFDSIPMEQTTEILSFRRALRELPSAQPEQSEPEELDFVQPHKKIDVRLEIGQPESTADAEFWRKRADYYSDMCSKLIADMGAGVKIEAVKIDETGITFTKKKPPAQSIDLQEIEDRFGEYVRFVVNDMLTGEGKRWTR